MTTNITSRRFSANPSKIRLIAITMGLYIVLVMWPAFDLCRMLFAADPLAFSIQRGTYAVTVALIFSLYSYWQMARLCLQKTE
ncbi:hypothetical protein [Zhongshania borealis]|uniref:Uncharacterized protein n=1 Tax=Zhongshania borealis TaxID=889488 RepID=A0ABP7WTW6_9GAMM